MTNELHTICEKNKKIFETIDSESIQFLADKYKNISMDDFEMYTHDKELGGWKAYSYCVKRGICSNMRAYFTLFQNTEFINPFEKYDLCSPKEAIEAIKGANGIPVLAHPGVSFYDPNLEFVLKYFYSQGIRGFECYHPDNSKNVTEYCLGFCNEHDLIITGGSDCHGDFVKTRMIGTPDIRLSQINLLDWIMEG